MASVGSSKVQELLAWIKKNPRNPQAATLKEMLKRKLQASSDSEPTLDTDVAADAKAHCAEDAETADEADGSSADELERLELEAMANMETQEDGHDNGDWLGEALGELEAAAPTAPTTPAAVASQAATAAAAAAAAEAAAAAASTSQAAVGTQPAAAAASTSRPSWLNMLPLEAADALMASVNMLPPEAADALRQNWDGHTTPSPATTASPSDSSGTPTPVTPPQPKRHAFNSPLPQKHVQLLPEPASLASASQNAQSLVQQGLKQHGATTTAQTGQTTQYNSATNPADYKQFLRLAAKRDVFPAVLCEDFQKDRTSLFAEWMRQGKKIDEVAKVYVAKTKSKTTEAETEWMYMKKRDVFAMYGGNPDDPESERSKKAAKKADAVCAAALQKGMCAPDPAFPDDEEEMQYTIQSKTAWRKSMKDTEEVGTNLEVESDSLAEQLTGVGGLLSAGSVVAMPGLSDKGSLSLAATALQLDLNDGKKPAKAKVTQKTRKRKRKDLKDKANCRSCSQMISWSSCASSCQKSRKKAAKHDTTALPSKVKICLTSLCSSWQTTVLTWRMSWVAFSEC